MNKTLKNLAMAITVCTALCATAMAAPKGNPSPKGKAPTTMKAPAKKTQAAKAPAKTASPAKNTARYDMSGPGNWRPTAANRTPPPKHERRHGQRGHHNHHHKHRHNDTLHTEDWCDIGASLIGGFLGGFVGSTY